MSRRLQIPGERMHSALLAACESALERAHGVPSVSPWPEPGSYLAAAEVLSGQPVDPARLDELWALQHPQGGFPAYWEGPPQADASATVWLAMRLGGLDSTRMRRLAEAIRSLGGVDALSHASRAEWALAGWLPADRVESGVSAAAEILHSMEGPTVADPAPDLSEIGGPGSARPRQTSGLKQWWARTGGAAARKLELARKLDDLARQAGTGSILDAAVRAAWRAALLGGHEMTPPSSELGSGHIQSFHGALQTILLSQEAEGGWRDAEGSIHGTWQALLALRAAGYDDREAEVLRAGEWLRSCQNADGGWSEHGASTVSHTSWALLGLIAGGDPASESATKAIEYLLAAQTPHGSWRERPWTRTVSPGLAYARDEARAHADAVAAVQAFLNSTIATRGTNG